MTEAKAGAAPSNVAKSHSKSKQLEKKWSHSTTHHCFKWNGQGSRVKQCHWCSLVWLSYSYWVL